MEISYSLSGRTLVVGLIGELDEHASESARKTLEKLFSGGNFNAVVFDLSRLSFMDSTGIGVLIGRYKQLKALNCPAYVKNPSKTVDKIFSMSGLYEIIKKIEN